MTLVPTMISGMGVTCVLPVPLWSVCHLSLCYLAFQAPIPSISGSFLMDSVKPGRGASLGLVSISFLGVAGY